ncbi:MAG: ribosome biogenesis GTPase Der [Christensenellaceae bacterium]|jgi:GTP-binding protein|nr:ribosome biogenesis GTPase Der [Christensenellaceae bacterium]
MIAMKTLPLVAIIGRPNVGKSTLFNIISGQNLSIVDDRSGVTRDRIIADAEWCGRGFGIVDTGGMDFEDESVWNKYIRKQARLAIELADVVVMLCDGVSGVLPDDNALAAELRKSKKPVILAVNKLDNKTREQNATEFYELGLGEPLPISCNSRRGIAELLDEVLKQIKPIDANELEEKTKIAIVGKPNAGKSSIVNRLLGEERVMVSDISGTTRDSVDSVFAYDGKEYILTDTAGIRRKANIEDDSIERFSVIRALAAIRNSDVCVLVVDAEKGLSEQDVRLAGYIHEQNKPSVIVINKWDTIEKDAYTMNKFKEDLARDLAFMSYFKSIFISAKTGQRIGEIMKTVLEVLENTNRRITTGVLNEIVLTAVSTVPPQYIRGKRAKFYYSSQVSSAPPTFALFVNDETLVSHSYIRYIENTIRKSADFSGTPIRIFIRNKNKGEE